MNDRDRILLQKIMGYIGEALSYTNGLGFDAFMQDSKTVNATAFVMGQAGELAKMLSEEIQKANPQIEWRGIRGLRNRIVHDYDNINMNMFWEVVEDDIPKLKQKIQELLERG